MAEELNEVSNEAQHDEGFPSEATSVSTSDVSITVEADNEDMVNSACETSESESEEENTKSAENEDQQNSGCEHYRRDCEVKAPCCGEWFFCRICHDKVKNEHEPDFKKKHTLNRHEISVVRCVKCLYEQAVS